MEERVRVLVRLRPTTGEEERANVEVQGPVIWLPSRDGKGRVEHALDGVFRESATQAEVFEEVEPAVRDVVRGLNATVFAYGVTGSGKTHTMLGRGPFSQGEGLGPRAGIIPRAAVALFQALKDRRSTVHLSLLQIYGDRATDLLADDQRPLAVREARADDGRTRAQRLQKGRVFVQGLSQYQVTSAADVFALVSRGLKSRATRATDANAKSSRSHAVLRLEVEVEVDDECDDSAVQHHHHDDDDVSHDSSDLFFSKKKRTNERRRNEKRDKKEETLGYRTALRRAKLTLVDLAGSEKWSPAADASSALASELRAINKSLSALGNCIAALAEGSNSKKMTDQVFVPYRDSTLTRVLQDTLGGATRTIVISTASASKAALEDTASTLAFAHRARKVTIRLRPEKYTERVLDGGALSLKKAHRDIADLKRRLLVATATTSTQTDTIPASSDDAARVETERLREEKMSEYERTVGNLYRKLQDADDRSRAAEVAGQAALALLQAHADHHQHVLESLPEKKPPPPSPKSEASHDRAFLPEQRSENRSFAAATDALPLESDTHDRLLAAETATASAAIALRDFRDRDFHDRRAFAAEAAVCSAALGCETRSVDAPDDHHARVLRHLHSDTSAISSDEAATDQPAGPFSQQNLRADTLAVSTDEAVVEATVEAAGACHSPVFRQSPVPRAEPSPKPVVAFQNLNDETSALYPVEARESPEDASSAASFSGRSAAAPGPSVEAVARPSSPPVARRGASQDDDTPPQEKPDLVAKLAAPLPAPASFLSEAETKVAEMSLPEPSLKAVLEPVEAPSKAISGDKCERHGLVDCFLCALKSGELPGFEASPTPSKPAAPASKEDPPPRCDRHGLGNCFLCALVRDGLSDRFGVPAPTQDAAQPKPSFVSSSLVSTVSTPIVGREASSSSLPAIASLSPTIASRDHIGGATTNVTPFFPLVPRQEDATATTSSPQSDDSAAFGFAPSHAPTLPPATDATRIERRRVDRQRSRMAKTSAAYHQPRPVVQVAHRAKAPGSSPQKLPAVHKAARALPRASPYGPSTTPSRRLH